MTGKRPDEEVVVQGGIEGQGANGVDAISGKTAGEVVDSLTGADLVEKFDALSSDEVLKMLENYHFPLQLLGRLTRHPDPKVRVAAVKHPNTLLMVLKVFIRDENPEVQEALQEKLNNLGNRELTVAIDNCEKKKPDFTLFAGPIEDVEMVLGYLRTPNACIVLTQRGFLMEDVDALKKIFEKGYELAKDKYDIFMLIKSLLDYSREGEENFLNRMLYYLTAKDNDINYSTIYELAKTAGTGNEKMVANILGINDL